MILVRWFSSLMRQTWAGLRVLVLFTLITGVLYPLAVWGVSRAPELRDKAEGSIVRVNDQPTGSQLIGVDLAAKDGNHDPWFHTRPSNSAINSQNPTDPNNALAAGDPSTSGGSNYAQSSDTQVKLVQERKTAIARREGVRESQVPPDAVAASASGVDPAISPAYAYLQVRRVARENGLSEQQVRQLVDQHTQGRGLGFLGEPTVNVLDLNLAVQQLAKP